MSQQVPPNAQGGCAAAFAWLVGMGASALLGSGQGLNPTVFALVVPLLIAALLGMGFAQWLVIRKCVAHSFAWVWVNGAAWARRSA